MEHFRPKGGFQQGVNLTMPSYYWLGYDWNNLLFSCEVCNRRYKKNRFPLKNINNRAKNHLADINLEEPLLINPYFDNPEIHIRFRKEVVSGKTEKGKESIKVYGLHRLEEKRGEYLQNINKHIIFNRINLKDEADVSTTMRLFNMRREDVVNEVNISRKVVATLSDNKIEYTGMIRSNYPEL